MMVRTLFKWVLVLLFAIISCTKRTSSDNIIDLTDYRMIKESINLSEIPDYLPGVILSMEKVQEDQYIFLDFSQRSIFHLDTAKNQLHQIGSHGDGPGEYRNPVYFQSVGQDTIAFTDISNMALNFIKSDGTFIKQIYHGLGGGKKFIINEDKIFILGNLSANTEQVNYQLTILDQDGNKRNELFPVKEIYENQVKSFGTGDMAIIDDMLFLVNTTEPVIYMFNLNTGETDEVKPFDMTSELFSMNDGYSLYKYSVAELREVYNEIVIFRGIGSVNLDGEKYIIVYGRKGKVHFSYFLDMDLTVKYYYSSNKMILGVSEDYIFEKEMNSTEGSIDLVTFSNFN